MDGAVEAVPGWFGPLDRQLFGWVHRPTASAVAVPAVVVICSSLGQEAVFSHYTMRQTADQLAARGCVVVRFDYDGTGDSAGAGDDPRRLAAWLTAIGHAIEFGRAHTDAPLALIGFRLGGLLASEAAAGRDDVHALVLWDAPRSGKQYLRELAVRQRVSVSPSGRPEPTDRSVLGLTLTPDAHDDLRGLELGRHAVLPAERVLSVERPGVRGIDTAATDRGGRAPDRVVAADQDDLLDRHALPHATRHAVVDWILSAARTDAGPSRLSANPTPDQTLALPGATERVVALGPHRLFGILTEPDEPVGGPTVVFVPDSITPHTGLSRIWTDLARARAAAGTRSLRFDLGGCGDSPARLGQPPQTPGLLAHLDDVADALAAVCPDDVADTVLVGLCSGAYLSIETALAVRPRAVAAINPVLSFITPEARPDSRRRALILTRRLLGRLLGRSTGRVAERLSHTHRTPAFTRDPNFAWSRALEACFWQVYLGDVAPWLPDRVWRLLNAALTTNRLHRILRAVRAGGTRTLLIAGDPDFVRTTAGSVRPLRALARQGGLTVEHVPGLDHAMMAPGDIALVTQALTTFLDDLVGASPATHDRPVPQAVS